VLILSSICVSGKIKFFEEQWKVSDLNFSGTLYKSLFVGNSILNSTFELGFNW